MLASLSIFFRSRLSLVLGSLSLAWLLIPIAIVQLAGQRQTIPLQSEAIQHDVGCAYIVEIRSRPFGWPITKFVSDSASATQASRLILLEEGKSVGQPHAMHEEIRSKGTGNYSHWGQSLYFSVPDCTDPRKNGRRYEASIPISFSAWAKTSWFVAAFVFGFLVVRRFSNNQKMRQSLCFIRKTVDAVLIPRSSYQHKVISGILFVFLLLSTGVFLAWVWGYGRSISLSVAGAYQVSDSMMYWLCSNTLLDMGNFGHPLTTGEWCQRRSTYPTFLSGIAWIAQRDIFFTLLLQASITSMAIFLVVRRSANFVGFFGALVCATLLFRYAAVDLFTLTMTENAGLIFACTGFAMLLKASERQSLPWMAVGIAMVSIAMNARVGAVFVLPFLVLWAGVVAHYFHQHIWKWLTAASIAVLAGFALQSILVLAVGGSLGNSYGNFSYTLYGLAVGGKGWHQALIDYPALLGSDAQMSKAIYALAWERITMQPELFLHGLQRNLSYFMAGGTYGFEKLGPASQIVKACWWLAWIPLFINRKNPFYLLLAFSSLGIVLSAPFLLMDGGPRIFAASIVVDALQISLGFFWIATTLTQGIKRGFSPAFRNKAADSSIPALRKVSPEGIFTLFLLLLLLIPFTPFRHIQTAAPIEAIKCIDDEYTVVTRIGRGGTMLLDVVSDVKKADFLTGQIRHADFVNGIPASAWWRGQVLAFNGKSLLLAYQQDKTDAYAPGPYPVFSDQNLSAYHGHTVRLCIDKTEKQLIFDIPYRKLNSITLLD